VRYAVFGCGNSDWTETFQAIPKLCDSLFEKLGGSRILPLGIGDVSQGGFFQVFDDFESTLWATLVKVRDIPVAQNWERNHAVAGIFDN
jgi:cytochrome P450/NADPH-cytochrome P450 reductase